MLSSTLREQSHPENVRRDACFAPAAHRASFPRNPSGMRPTGDLHNEERRGFETRARRGA
jgi:hypothetical protein